MRLRRRVQSRRPLGRQRLGRRPLGRRLLSWTALLTMLSGGLVALITALSPAASAMVVVPGEIDGYVRIAHLSPEAPGMDMYLYPFGNPTDPTILRDVSYGEVSAYVKLTPGEYTVAMRGAGASPSSKPALTTSFMVEAGTAYTLAAIGPDPGLRTEVFRDQTAAPSGKSLIRVLQASLRQSQVTVSYGSHVLARKLAFGSLTTYTAVSAGAQTIHMSASGADASTPVELTAGSVHTIVVLDGSDGLTADSLTDAVGSQVLPLGGAQTGFGGTAGRPSPNPAVWLIMIAVGMAVISWALSRIYRPERVTA